MLGASSAGADNETPLWRRVVSYCDCVIRNRGQCMVGSLTGAVAS